MICYLAVDADGGIRNNIQSIRRLDEIDMAVAPIVGARPVDVVSPLVVLRGDEGKFATMGLSQWGLPISPRAYSLASHRCINRAPCEGCRHAPSVHRHSYGSTYISVVLSSQRSITGFLKGGPSWRNSLRRSSRVATYRSFTNSMLMLDACCRSAPIECFISFENCGDWRRALRPLSQLGTISLGPRHGPGMQGEAH